MQLLVNDDSESISKQAVVAYFMVLSRNFLKELTESVSARSKESRSAFRHMGHPNLNQQCYQLR